VPQDFSCPECGRIVRAYKPAAEPPMRGRYYYPDDRHGVLARQGYAWIRPYAHRAPDGKPCIGSLNRYYVGDGEL
jgi:hypothetical protein